MRWTAILLQVSRSAQRVVTASFLILLLGGCSLQRIAVNRLGDAIAESGATYASDDDPVLVGDALPFTLKLIESLIAESPRHEGLLIAAARGFTQYAYGWIHLAADELAPEDYTAATRHYDRAKRMYLRARNYGLRALEVEHPGMGERLLVDPAGALAATSSRDVPALYWTAASFGLAISLSKDDPELIADQPVVEALIDRSLQLDEAFEHGAIHTFLITYEPSRPGGGRDAEGRARRHFDRAVELSQGELATPYVALAESIAIPAGNRSEFEHLIEKALAIDPDARPEWRMENLISMRRAEWLRSRVDDLFFDDEFEEEDEP